MYDVGMSDFRHFWNQTITLGTTGGLGDAPNPRIMSNPLYYLPFRTSSWRWRPWKTQPVAWSGT